MAQRWRPQRWGMAQQQWPRLPLLAHSPHWPPCARSGIFV
jgi:hypothetical protein